ncbi:hypothetical protein THRCLA_07343 [Thraustotheca clavata]|uniref:AGC-kinase C-terminal domain-containing protein n=1 Tax=Thraustotheca clavata TaxID=74557 RepID=A0A1V9ZE92_9STRA|nr:hypothetical protein THRCLA_07343 [Thraustotheca clavata]
MKSHTPIYKGKLILHSVFTLEWLKGKFRFSKNTFKMARDFISKLLQPNITQRLVDPAIIRQHPWFSSVSWSDIEGQQIIPPIQRTFHCRGDVSHFDLLHLPDEPQQTYSDENVDFCEFLVD